MKNTFYNSFDLERVNPESAGDSYRTAFQVDRDRVMHTPTFRSLQSKTQVFWSGEYDFYRTRLTHSLEVAQIGRSICHWLQHSSELLREDYFIDPDLVEASCLSHDLGHPPFGHAGEKSLNQLMATAGGFEGNAQTLRLITERIFTTSKRGMNPTRAFVDSILKYKTLWTELKRELGKEPKNHFLYDEQFEYLDWVFGGRDFPIEYTPGEARDSFRSIELQIMDWSDDTAYSLHDISDSVRAGFLTVERIEKWAKKSGLSITEDKPLVDLLESIRKGDVDVMMSRKIGDYIQATSIEESLNFMSTITNRYRYDLVIDLAVKAELAIFKKLAFEVVFLSPELNQLEYKGDHLLRNIWDVLKQRYVTRENMQFNLLPESIGQELDELDSEKQRMRVLCDAMASFTDGSATRLYKRLNTPDFGSIGDLV